MRILLDGLTAKAEDRDSHELTAETPWREAKNKTGQSLRGAIAERKNRGTQNDSTAKGEYDNSISGIPRLLRPTGSESDLRGDRCCAGPALSNWRNYSLRLTIGAEDAWPVKERCSRTSWTTNMLGGKGHGPGHRQWHAEHKANRGRASETRRQADRQRSA